MTRQLISSGSTFEQDIGYSRAVVVGDWIFVSGTTGFDYATMTISDSLPEQTEHAGRPLGGRARAQPGDGERLVVAACYANQGPSLKRVRPAPMGRVVNVARLSGIGVKTISSFETGERIGSLKLAQLERLVALGHGRSAGSRARR